MHCYTELDCSELVLDKGMISKYLKLENARKILVKEANETTMLNEEKTINYGYHITFLSTRKGIGKYRRRDLKCNKTTP